MICLLETEMHIDINTRQSNHFHQPIARTEAIKRTLRYQAVKVSNFFRTKIDYNCSLKTFKSTLKELLISTDIVN